MKRTLAIFCFLVASTLAVGCNERVIFLQCEDGERLCENDISYICVDGDWDAISICEYGCNNHACKKSEADCEDGAVICENGKAHVCENGHCGD